MFQRNEIRIQTEIARLGPLLFQIIVTLLGGGQINAAGAVNAAGLARELFQLLVEIDRVALQPRDVGIGIDRVDDARRMP